MTTHSQAAGDAGGALGAALFAWHQLLDGERSVAAGDAQHGSLLGPACSSSEVRSYLDGIGATYRHEQDEKSLLDLVVEHLTAQRIVGWFDGRMEYGPRALGSRSILADARNSEMQSRLNLKIKRRESFRPFAPCVLREHAARIFELSEGTQSPYMSLVTKVRKSYRVPIDEHAVEQDVFSRARRPRSQFPAITHVDYSARVQTVDAQRHGRFYRLLKRFEEAID